MPTYDPQRSRPRQRAEAGSPAPVDALLGAVPEESGTSETPQTPGVPAEQAGALVVDLDAPSPVGPTAGLAPRRNVGVVSSLVALVALVVSAAVVVLAVRARARRQTGG